jgi:hypothetical protein
MLEQVFDSQASRRKINYPESIRRSLPTRGLNEMARDMEVRCSSRGLAFRNHELQMLLTPRYENAAVKSPRNQLCKFVDVAAADFVVSHLTIPAS